MPANRFNGYTDYGIGIGLRVPHYQHILERKPVVDWFEIISENYMVDGGRPLAILDQILSMLSWQSASQRRRNRPWPPWNARRKRLVSEESAGRAARREKLSAHPHSFLGEVLR
jgi:Protein of unknown function (DUF692)